MAMASSSISNKYLLIPQRYMRTNLSVRYLHVDMRRRHFICAELLMPMFAAAASVAPRICACTLYTPSIWYMLHLLNVHTLHTLTLQYQHPKKNFISLFYGIGRHTAHTHTRTHTYRHIPGAIFAHYDELKSTNKKKKKQIKKNT